MIKLDIGCRTQRPDVIGIDPYLVPPGGVKAALDVGLPFKDNSVDVIYAYHVLEHAPDLVKAMEELWRVCKEGSLVYVRVPHASSSYVTWVDPTHRRGLTIETFAAFTLHERARFDLDYARLRFITRSAGAEPSPVRRLLGDVLEALANHNRAAQYRCERWWGPWVGFDEAFIILRAMKEWPPPGHRRRAVEARRTLAVARERGLSGQGAVPPGKRRATA
jgi:SAM-dependent methyltransferase